MKYVIKNRGEALYELVKRFRKQENLGEDIKITYAGRLDPMADGLVLLLVGDEVHHKETYLKKDKTYRMTVVFGVSTDTYDGLGTITETGDGAPTQQDIKQACKELKNESIQSYPPYSSKPVDGKPLWQHAREGSIDTLKRPTQEITIKSIEIIEYATQPKTEIITGLISDIKKVKGDFRQQEIIQGWQTFLDTNPDDTCVVVTIEIHASAGTYMRTIAHELGEKVGVPAYAHTITRTRIGDMEQQSCKN